MRSDHPEATIALAAHDQGRVRIAGEREAASPIEEVVAAGDGGLLSPPQGTYDCRAFIQTLDAFAMARKPDSEHLVLPGKPAGAEPQIEAPAG